MADDKPIIVVKKKGGHGGHHGGAWKIAYADFVTAMMAFFMVMWLVNSASVQTRQSIASYFRKPGIFNEGSGTPLLLGGAGILDDAFVPPKPEEKQRARKKKKVFNQAMEPQASGESDRDLDKNYMEEGTAPAQAGKGPTEISGLNSKDKQIVDLAREIEIKKAAGDAGKELMEMMQMPDLSSIIGALDIKVDADGLNIEIMDTDKASMFESGSAKIKLQAEAALAKIATIVKKFPNTLEISGHTDAKPFPSRTGGYTNWELSADRSNAARRIFEKEGVASENISSVIGKAATQLRNTEDPLAPENRRISLKLKFNLAKKLEIKQCNDSLKELDDLLTSPPPALTAVEDEKTHSLSAGDILEGKVPENKQENKSGSESKNTTKDLSDNPDFMPEDKIFNDNPVIGPAELFGSGR